MLALLLFLPLALATTQFSDPTISAYAPSGRIINGDLAKDKQFPWQVAVYFDTANGSFFCGGSLIDPEWVMTSGHCINGAKIFTLHLGSNLLVDADPNRVTVAATKSKLHPNFDVGSLDNDIGLIHLDKPVELNDYIQTIALTTNDAKDAETVTLSGWGSSGDWPGVETKLLYVQLSTISNKDCQAVYGDVINEDMVCALGKQSEGPCEGDTGGALMRTSDQSAEQVGIASFVSSAGCTSGHPSGYTRVAKYLDWITSTIAS